MKHLLKYITALLPLLSAMLLHVSPGSAEELFKQFSLGGGSLTAAPSDAKAPEPGVVTAKYGFKIAKDFMPYMGTGLAYTYQPDIKTGDITRLKTGVAAQFGFNYLLGENSTLKLDYKYLSVSPEQTRGDSRTAPQSLGIGLDIKF
ncbi:MAG: outer membrane beta-barrel protein [Geobacteraceae bacterium]|nr:outer membrane beta-barrel protein [Geobacteraceae bacterium]